MNRGHGRGGGNELPNYGRPSTQNFNLGGHPTTSNAMTLIRQYTSTIEDWLSTIEEPIKPYVPGIGRFLVVGTFLEDAFRIVTQWTEQLIYLNEYRHIPTGLTHLFLLFNILTMAIASLYIIFNKKIFIAAVALVSVVVVQGIGYGLIFDLNFFLRNLSVIGGLVLVLSDSLTRRPMGGASLPTLNERDKKMYVQLFGRVLLIFLFIGFVFSGEWSAWRLVVSGVGFVASLMVVVGFKAKYSAVLLVIILSVFNILVNNFWTLHPHHPHKDFAKYDFFQTLSIVGGLLLLVSKGPGDFSMDQNKKVY